MLLYVSMCNTLKIAWQMKVIKCMLLSCVNSEQRLLQDVTAIESVKQEGKVWVSHSGVGEESILLENYIISIDK
jgi:hypothetical protein